MSYLIYQQLISRCWDYPLPVLTKAGKPSFHRKGIRNGKVRLRENPLWEKDYINSINIDRPEGLTKRSFLKMTSSDLKCKGFWSNPFLYTSDEIKQFKIDVYNYYPEKLYYDWLKNTEEGFIRLANLKVFKHKYLITNDLLFEPLKYSDPIQHHGQVLLLLLTSCERYISPKWQPYSHRSIVRAPSEEALRQFYFAQTGLEASDLPMLIVEPSIKAKKKSTKKEKQLALSLS